MFGAKVPNKDGIISLANCRIARPVNKTRVIYMKTPMSGRGKPCNSSV